MNLVLRILGIGLWLLGVNAVQAQNVGVGTTQPKSRLHVAGNIQTDSALVVKPIVKAAADAISISNRDGFVVITAVTGTQTNAITMTGTPKNGQMLSIYNRDGDDATFSGATVQNGTISQLSYFYGTWKAISFSQKAIRDTDDDTRVTTEATTDEDQVKMLIDGTLRWTFNEYNITPNFKNSVFIGRYAGSSITSGDKNTSFGSFSSEELTTGSYNSAFGYNSLNACTTGSSNIGFGSASLYSVVVGSNNVAMGRHAGYNTTGSGNLFLGNRAGFYETGSAKLYIANSDDTTPLIYGDFATNFLRINGTLNINGSYSLPTSNGAPGQVLETDGFGGTSWETPNADDQQVNKFSLSGSTLKLSLERDGQTDRTVNLSSINTDNQTVDKLSLSGSTLSLSLESDGASDYTVDLSSIDTDTDNQTVDKLSLSGTVLSLSLEDDGASDYTVDLSSIDTSSDTDDQAVDKFSLSGSTLSLSLEDDGASDYTVDLSSIDTDTDDQTVDKFSLSGSTLSLSLEDDGASDYTVDLSSIDTDMDDQTVDKFSLSGSTLSLSLEGDGASDYTVNLSSIDTDTDDQTVDKFSLSGSILSLSLEDDGASDYTADLSSINTDDQAVDKFSLSGTTLSLSLEDDGASDYTVNLSSIDTDTDDQTVDKFSLSGTTLSLSLESDGQSDKTVDLSSINSTKSLIADADSDTKIQVEETTDEDLVRMDIAGTERWVFNDRTIAPKFNSSVFVGSGVGAAVTTATLNTAVGLQSLASATTGSSNVALGYRSLYSQVTGSQNVAIGRNAGHKNTGSGNVFIGYHAGYNETTSDKLYIDNSNVSNPLIYGDFDNDFVKINGWLRTTGSITPSTNNFHSLGSSSLKWKEVYAQNGTIQTSDERFKKNIIDMNYGLEELMALRSVTYQWKEDSLGETKLGFIAQELEQIVPEVVTVANDSMQTRGVNYSELIPVLVKAIQEQQALIEAQKSQLDAQEAETAENHVRLESLEAKLDILLNNIAANN